MVKTTGTQTYNGTTTFGATTILQTSGGDVSAPGAVTATAGTLTLNTGAGNATFNNTSNNFSTVGITSGGTVSLVDANAMTLAASSMGSLTAQTLTGDLTLSGNITASGSGNAIVLAAADNFINSVGFRSVIRAEWPLAGLFDVSVYFNSKRSYGCCGSDVAAAL